MSDDIDRLLSSLSAKPKPPAKERKGDDTLIQCLGMMMLALSFLEHECSNNASLKFSPKFLETIQELSDAVAKRLGSDPTLQIIVQNMTHEEVMEYIKKVMLGESMNDYFEENKE